MYFVKLRYVKFNFNNKIGDIVCSLPFWDFWPALETIFGIQ